MARRQGQWIKPREPYRLSSEGKAAIRPQTEKIREAGARVKKECTGKKGTEFKRCRSEILEQIFGKKK